MNISQDGVLIYIKEMFFPFETEFQIIIYTGDEILNIPVKLLRIQMSPHGYDRLAVQLMKRPRNYLDFLDSLSSAR